MRTFETNLYPYVGPFEKSFPPHATALRHPVYLFIATAPLPPPALLVLVRMLPSIPDSRVGADMRFPPQKLDGFSYVERVWGCGGLVVVATPHGIFLFFAYSMRIHAIN